MQYSVNIEFHNKYYDEMYDKIVKVFLKSGEEIVGAFCDEFYEKEAIMIASDEILLIAIKDIEKMVLAE